MKPAWDQLGESFADSKTVLIGDVDCTIEKDLCSRFGVRGYPTIKYFTGATAADGDTYEGGRDFDSLKAFADESLGPSCAPDNRDLCDEEQLKEIDAALAQSAEDLDAQIKEIQDGIETAEKYLKDEVAKLQERYQELNKEKDDKIAELSPGLRVLRSAAAFKKADGAAAKDEL
jgi:thioredoxin-like negative regulator of GroEL